MVPEEVEQLQSQLTAGQLEPGEFLALVLSMYDFEEGKLHLRAVIHSLRVLVQETQQGSSLADLHGQLVTQYQQFFCEQIDHTENIERFDRRRGLENRRVNFDDEETFISDEDLKELPDIESLTTATVSLSINKPNSKHKKSKKLPPKESPVILWFRRDLRLYDNPALVSACSLNRPVIPVFLWSQAEEGGAGAERAARVWLERALAALDSSLANSYNSKLVYRRCDSYEAELVSLVRETGARTVVWSALYEPQLAARDTAVQRALERLPGVTVEVEHSYLLRRPDQVSLAGVGVRGLGSVTHFMECCKRNPGDKIGSPVEPPARMVPPAAWPPGCTTEQLGLYRQPVRADGSRVDWAAGIRGAWQPGEQAGFNNLTRFLQENVGNYESESGRADQDWTAQISPYLHWGELSPRTVLHEAHVGRVAAKFRRKLAWRDLSYWLLSIWPDLATAPVRSQYSGQEWREDRQLLAGWQRGKTGFPLVDAAMRQLWAVGWMNNYMRHVVASFLISYLRYSWTDGLAWFQDTLVDADLAINAMMWQNGGFSGVDQWNFVMHPVKAAATCDPRGDYVRRWVPELASLPDNFIHQPWRCPSAVLSRAGVRLGSNYPHRCLTNLESEREQSLQSVVAVRLAHPHLVHPQYGADLLVVAASRLGLPAQHTVSIPLITRKEFIFRTSRPDSQDNPHDAVLLGYHTRQRDEQIARNNKVDFTASTMLEFSARQQRKEQEEGGGGRGRGKAQSRRATPGRRSRVQ